MKTNTATDQFQIGAVLLAISIITFLGILSETALNIVYSSLMDEFGVSAATVQWLTTGYFLTLAALIPLSPLFVKQYPSKKLFQTAALLCLTGTLLCALSVNFMLLLLGRIIQAIGTSIALPLMINIILEKISVYKRGRIMGMVGLITSFAPVLGPIFGGAVSEWLNWHWIFFFMLPLLIISFILGSKYIMDIHQPAKLPFDYSSILLSTLAFTGMIYAISRSTELGWYHGEVLDCLSMGIISLAVFIKRQLSLDHPLLQVHIFKYPMFATGVGIVMLSMMIVLAAGFILPLYLQKALGYSSFTAALTMLPGALMNGIMAPVSGKILDKKGPFLLLLVGFALVSITVFIFSAFSCPLYMVLLLYTAFMFGASMLAMPAQTHSLNQVAKPYNADATAIINTLQQLSGALGTALSSSIFTATTEALLASGPDTSGLFQAQAVAIGTQETFFFLFFLSLLGLYLALNTRKSATSDCMLR